MTIEYEYHQEKEHFSYECRVYLPMWQMCISSSAVLYSIMQAYKHVIKYVPSISEYAIRHFWLKIRQIRAIHIQHISMGTLYVYMFW